MVKNWLIAILLLVVLLQARDIHYLKHPIPFEDTDKLNGIKYGMMFDIPVNTKQIEEEEQMNYDYYNGLFSPEWNLDVEDWVAKC